MLAAIMGIITATTLQRDLAQLPEWDGRAISHDWLISADGAKAQVLRTKDGRTLVLSNGLVSRFIQLTPNASTVGLNELTSTSSLVRAASPEAVLSLDGKQYEVGGLKGQTDLAYLTPEWRAGLMRDPTSFQFQGFETGPTAERMPWVRKRSHEAQPWPTPGMRLTLDFRGSKGPCEDLTVKVQYELYDGMPLFRKSLKVINDSTRAIRLDSFELERLRLAEPESQVESTDNWLKANVSILSDYSFGGAAQNDLNRVVNWDPDPEYGTQVSYDLKTPCVLRVAPPLGPATSIPPGGSFESFHAFMVVHDSWDRERKGLEVRKVYRALAPWVTENPLMLHLTSTEPSTVKRAIDQAADVGFEMVIFSFGSGLDMEDVSPGNIKKYKEVADYAHSKGIEVGGYSLLASRRIDDETDVIDPKTGKPGHAVFGNSPCLGSKWGQAYFEHLKEFLSGTGFDLLEHDGSYPGDVCASTKHPGHKGLADSQWTQFETISSFYRWCRERGIFLNVPDNYMFSGSNKTGMGYRETNWSLPREQQHIHARQNLFDGTWLKPPTMGWMFVPLVEYQGGGAAATIEPLHEHLEDYRLHLMTNLGFGAQACYRGPRLYDTEETQAMVRRCVEWFKAHRAILESDVIHMRRADGQRLDCILHVNPKLAEKGMLVVWNPTSETVKEELSVPLYYTGLTETATLTGTDGAKQTLKLARDYSVQVQVSVPAKGMTWMSIK